MAWEWMGGLAWFGFTGSDIKFRFFFTSISRGSSLAGITKPKFISTNSEKFSPFIHTSYQTNSNALFEWALSSNLYRNLHQTRWLYTNETISPIFCVPFAINHNNNNKVKNKSEKYKYYKNRMKAHLSYTDSYGEYVNIVSPRTLFELLSLKLESDFDAYIFTAVSCKL